MTRIIEKAPSTKFPPSEKLQVLNPKTPPALLKLGAGNFSGAWILDFGISFKRLHLDGQYRRKIAHDGVPRIAAVRRTINLTARRSEINAAFIEGIHGHRVAQHIHVAILLRQTLRQRFPFVTACLAAIHAQLSVERKMLGVALDGHNVNGLWLVRVNVNREAEVGR